MATLQNAQDSAALESTTSSYSVREPVKMESQKIAPIESGSGGGTLSGAATTQPVGMSDPNPTLIPPPSGGGVNDMPVDDPVGQGPNMGVSLDDLREPAPPVAQADSASIATPGAIDPALAAASGAEASAAGSVNADATGYNAKTGEVDPSKMTAAGQLNEITSLDSANMRRAANQGMLTAARRGLMNSSFAAGAAQGAMVDRATPLAQQDAATYFQNMRMNLDAENRAAEVSTGRETDMAALNAQLESQTELFNAEQANKMAELNAQLQTAVSQGNADMINRIASQMQEIEMAVNTRNAELEVQTNLANADMTNRMNQEVLRGYQRLNEQYLQGEQQIDIAAIQGRYQQLISSNAAAASIYQSYMQSIGDAMANDKVTPQRVAMYINTMAQQMEGSLALIDAMNGLDLGGVNLPGAGSGGSGKNTTIYPSGTTQIGDSGVGDVGPTPTTPTPVPDNPYPVNPGDYVTPGNIFP